MTRAELKRLRAEHDEARKRNHVDPHEVMVATFTTIAVSTVVALVIGAVIVLTAV